MKHTQTFFLTCLITLLLTLPLQAQEPQIIADQGQTGALPAPSLAALTLAAALGCDGARLGLVLSQDNQVMVLSTIDLGGITDVATRFPDRAKTENSFPAFALSLAELRQLAWQSAPPYHHGPITLNEVLALQRLLKDRLGRDLILNLELRQPRQHQLAGHDLARAVLETIRAAGHSGRVDSLRLQSYDHEELRRLRQDLLPEYGLNLDLIQLIDDNDGQEAQVEQWGVWLPYNYDWMLSRSGLRLLATLVQGIGLDQSRLADASGTPLPGDTLADLKTLGLTLQVRGLDQGRLPSHAQDLTQLADLFTTLIPADSLITDNCGQLAQARRQRLLNPQTQNIRPPIDLIPAPVPLPAPFLQR